MAEHRSGSARRRKRRLAKLEADLHDQQSRARNGGDAISTANTALRGVMMLAAGCTATLDITGDELACLLGLITDEVEAGLALQNGST